MKWKPEIICSQEIIQFVQAHKTGESQAGNLNSKIWVTEPEDDSGHFPKLLIKK
jgi:hypothetical protein